MSLFLSNNKKAGRVMLILSIRAIVDFLAFLLVILFNKEKIIIFYTERKHATDTIQQLVLQDIVKQ